MIQFAFTVFGSWSVILIWCHAKAPWESRYCLALGALYKYGATQRLHASRASVGTCSLACRSAGHGFHFILWRNGVGFQDDPA